MRISLFLPCELLMSHRFLETQVLLRSINLHEFSLVTNSLHVLKSELAQRVKPLAAKTDNLRLIPGTHVVMGEKRGRRHLVRESAGIVLLGDKALDPWERQ